MLGLGKQIEVAVEVHGLAAQYVAAGTYRVREGATVGAVLRKAATVRGRPPLTLMIEGRRVDETTPIRAGETLKVLQMPAGG